MVDISDINRASVLASEQTTIDATLKAIDADARIVRVVFSGPNTDPPNVQFWTDTTYMDYPPQMTETIKGLLIQRQQQILDELEGLGVTGVSEHRR